MIDQLCAEIEAEEGRVLKVYKCPAGKNTIGVGRNLDDVGMSGTEIDMAGHSLAEILNGAAIPDACADLMLNNDIERAMAQLDKTLPWWVIKSKSTRRAMVNMVFQMGMSGFLKFNRMLACLQAGDYEGAKKHGLESKWAREDSPARAKRIVEMFQP